MVIYAIQFLVILSFCVCENYSADESKIAKYFTAHTMTNEPPLPGGGGYILQLFYYYK